MGATHRINTIATGGATGIVSLILIAASLLFLFFIVLSGVTNKTPFGKTYFLQADTSSIAGARPVSRWTFFYVCGDNNQDCGKPVPALPFGYAWVGGGSGAPSKLLGAHGKHTTSTHYYYLWRFGWVFYLIAFLADVVSFFTAMAAPFSRLAAGISGFLIINALFWMTLAASLMTAEFVQARNAFRANGMSAKIGTYAFAWTWAAWAAMFLATILLFVGCASGGNRSRKTNNSVISDRPTNGHTNGNTNGNLGFWRRQRTRGANRGSFVDTESQRRVVKDEYN
ncbi:Protein SUR7 [Lachnellula cervina]|uniref:Protein SUR7 n=1 Tax=Lachnellula cervina TaxID=1316786 RepID=A0A7D8UMQ7_9HELO|nr:Protein SUR7 [Lachnellula cervina]